jgi:hypothetical protein
MIDDEGWGVKSIHYCSIFFNQYTVQVEDSCSDAQIRKHPISERGEGAVSLVLSCCEKHVWRSKFSFKQKPVKTCIQFD